ncbi:Aste57867_3019 [Aphanomyces stellatus]|uniref:Aste57867_3019 protein n=1 Tax=Aphanomyces stellatus TaxID=120398 RepID=A0A485K9V2_9STRA|nr:hypothetical protein As57867_003010 [Aphanomyces stellatus]VFT80199.1 Aste57867_3019 [Aphanomyces stellatus]
MEIGVGIWIKESDEWTQAHVRNVKKKGSRGHEADVTFEYLTGGIQTLAVDVAKVEDGSDDIVKLSNSTDMDLVDDLIRLPNLHEPGICHTLSERFNQNDIYTLTGEILLAVNPFQDLGIYSDKLIRKYIRNGMLQSLGDNEHKMPPHVFGIADAAFRSLTAPLTGVPSNQSILVSGESGAGKTETTKFIMKYLASVSQSKSMHHININQSDVMSQVLSSSPILEAFGNARTIRNDNSSRFGKFIQMQFSHRAMLIGAGIQTYLLETVRVTSQAYNERNYHVFYELLAGLAPELKREWGLSSPQAFHYLNQSECYIRKDGVKDAAQFDLLKDAMETMQFSDEHQTQIFYTLAMLLHLGNLTFHANVGNAEGSVLANACAAAQHHVMHLFAIDQSALELALCTRKIQARDEWYTLGLLPEVAEQQRDALARHVYHKLFNWLVRRVNETVDHDADDDLAGFIGVLDIFGFEDLSTNSFEQLCINFANETLQNHFNATVLKAEQVTYERERIAWSFINFPDNQPCLDLLDKKPIGLFHMLDEECIVPQGSDQNFARKVTKQHDANAYLRATNADKANHVFGIHHYAGWVNYDTYGFLDKNKDVLHSEIALLVKHATNPFLREITAEMAKREAPPPPRGILKRTTNAAAKMSVGATFRAQLRVLMDTIQKTQCAYVRCLKPNDKNKPNVFSFQRICDQLKAGGVLEAVRVNRSGYPVRITHAQFIKRYRPLGNAALLKQIPDACSDESLSSPAARKDATAALAAYLQSAFMATDKTSPLQVGLTKVFFRRTAIQYVEAQLAKRYGEFVVLIQSLWRRYLAQTTYRKALAAILVLQTAGRRYLAKKRVRLLLEKKRRAEAELRRRLDEEAARRRQHEAQEAPIPLAAIHRVSSGGRLSAESLRPSQDRASEDFDEAIGGGMLRPSSASSSNPFKFRFTRDYTDESAAPSHRRQAPRQVEKMPGDTVLHLAANCCNEQDVLALLENGASVLAMNFQGRTPLHTAAMHHNIDVIAMLIDWDSDLSAQDLDGNTPLHLATDPHVARMLLEAGTNPNIVNEAGKTPLLEATERGDLHIVRALLSYHCDAMYCEPKHRQSALHLAVRKGHYTIINELCKTRQIADLIELQDRNGNNVLHFAVSKDRKNGPRLVQFLLQYGASRVVDTPNLRQQTPLVVHVMTTRQTDPIVSEILLEAGANPQVALNDGSTVLHVAVGRELLDIACTLIKYGAQLNATDRDGVRVVELAQRDNVKLKKLIDAITGPPLWMSEKEKRSCMVCAKVFGFAHRRHHCKHCGRICCSECAAFSVELWRFPPKFPGRITPGGKNVTDGQRVCRTCHGVFKTRSAKKEAKSGFLAKLMGYEWEEMSAVTSRNSLESTSNASQAI